MSPLAIATMATPPPRTGQGDCGRRTRGAGRSPALVTTICVVLFVAAPLAGAQTTAYAPVATMHPRDGWELTDVGVSFRWQRQVEPGRWATWTYRLQVARDPGFGHPEIDRVVDPLAENRRPGDPWADCRQMSYTPPELLPTGAWYWRVRVADGDGGPWSAPTRFVVNSDHRVAPILRPIGADRPLAVFDMWNLEARRDISWADYWRTIPADLRPYVAFQVNRFGVGRDPESDFPFYQTMQRLADLRLPCYVGTGGPSKPVSCYSDPAELEWMFQHFPTLDGIVTGETFWAYGPRATEEARYYNRVLQLCAKYGRHFIQGDGNWGHFNWDRFFAAKPRGATDSPVCDRADPDLLRACGASQLPAVKRVHGRDRSVGSGLSARQRRRNEEHRADGSDDSRTSPGASDTAPAVFLPGAWWRGRHGRHCQGAHLAFSIPLSQARLRGYSPTLLPMRDDAVRHEPRDFLHRRGVVPHVVTPVQRVAGERLIPR